MEDLLPTPHFRKSLCGKVLLFQDVFVEDIDACQPLLPIDDRPDILVVGGEFALKEDVFDPVGVEDPLRDDGLETVELTRLLILLQGKTVEVAQKVCHLLLRPSVAPLVGWNEKSPSIHEF